MGHNVLRPRPGLLVALLVALALAGCASNPSTLQPASRPAAELAGLWWYIFWIGTSIFVIVSALLVYAIIRFSRDKTPGEPRPVYGNTRLEIMWTAFPAVVLVALLTVTVETMASTREPANTALTVRVIGHQWWWEVVYPDHGIVSASEIHIPVGQPVSIDLESVDVIHSFWVPELFGKTDAIPGRVNRTWITADQPGTYWAHCAEYCGTQHANMAFLVVAHPPEEFAAWVQQHQQPAARLPEQDMPVFVQKGCVGCHAINGSAVAVGQTGPNLTHFGSRQTIAAGTLTNTPENLARWLHNPDEVKPGNVMGTAVQPGTLTEDEIEQLVNYLHSLK